MSHKFIVFAVIIFIMLVIFLLVFALKMCSDPKSVVKEGKGYTSKKVDVEGVESNIIQYKKGKCLIVNKLNCPPGWGPISIMKCEEKLSECQGNYEAIQKFCDVNCQESLEACLLDLQYEKEKRLYGEPYLGYYL